MTERKIKLNRKISKNQISDSVAELFIRNGEEIGATRKDSEYEKLKKEMEAHTTLIPDLRKSIAAMQNRIKQIEHAISNIRRRARQVQNTYRHRMEQLDNQLNENVRDPVEMNYMYRTPPKGSDIVWRYDEETGVVIRKDLEHGREFALDKLGNRHYLHDGESVREQFANHIKDTANKNRKLKELEDHLEDTLTANADSVASLKDIVTHLINDLRSVETAIGFADLDGDKEVPFKDRSHRIPRDIWNRLPNITRVSTKVLDRFYDAMHVAPATDEGADDKSAIYDGIDYVKKAIQGQLSKTYEAKEAHTIYRFIQAAIREREAQRYGLKKTLRAMGVNREYEEACKTDGRQALRYMHWLKTEDQIPELLAVLKEVCFTKPT